MKRLLGLAFTVILLSAWVVRAETANLTVSAAISLKDVLEQIKTVYQAQQSAVTLTFNFGASGALQQQIENGAPVDVFLSAATKQIEALDQKNLLLAGTKRNLLQNQLVLITARAGIATITDLTNATRIAAGEPKSVPAGQYTQETLAALKLADRLQPKMIYAKDVRQVLTYVETGNVDAGFVYATDTRLSAKVKLAIIVPDNLHSPIIYPVAVVAGTKHAAAAKDFLAFLTSPEARALFEKAGFTALAK